jgi:acid phosphatase
MFKMQSSLSVLLAALTMTAAQTITTSEPALPAIEAAAATTLPYSPVSNYSGIAFDRFIQVWLENVVGRSRVGRRCLT